MTTHRFAWVLLPLALGACQRAAAPAARAAVNAPAAAKADTPAPAAAPPAPKPSQPADREDVQAAAAWSPAQAYRAAPATGDKVQVGVTKAAEPRRAAREAPAAAAQPVLEVARPAPLSAESEVGLDGSAVRRLPQGLRGTAGAGGALFASKLVGGDALADVVAKGRIGCGTSRGYLAAPPRSSDKVFRALPPRPDAYPKDARYRSNYLPGRGALAHLAAEIDKGAALAGVGAVSVPQPTAPSLEAPDQHALRVAIDLSQRVLPTSGGQTVLRVRLRSSDRAAPSRGPLRLHVVLDMSGSMKGKPWQQVCAAMRDLATRLLPTDQLSVTTYSNSAQVLSAPTPGGAELSAVAERVCRIQPRGETNTLAGLQLGYQQARGAWDAQATNRVLLLSDGMPTIGPNDPYALTTETARALGEGITTSALGLGRDFDALLMGRVALEGGGNSHFVRDAAALPAVLTDELEVLSRQAAEAVDVRIALPEEVRLLEVVGSEPLGIAESLRVRQVEVASDQRLARDKGIAADRQRDTQGGVRFLLPSFRAGDEHAFVLVLGVPPGAAGWQEVAHVTVRYKDTVAGENAAFEGVRGVEMGGDPLTAEATQEPAVLLAEARARAAVALQRASEYLDQANVSAIRDELYVAATALQAVADRTGSAPTHAEADRVRGVADHAALALRRGQAAWMIAWLHYDWRLCGVTAWAI